MSLNGAALPTVTFVLASDDWLQTDLTTLLMPLPVALRWDVNMLNTVWFSAAACRDGKGDNKHRLSQTLELRFRTSRRRFQSLLRKEGEIAEM